MDGSTRSSHSNVRGLRSLHTYFTRLPLEAHVSCFILQAYMYGFFKNKRIVLYDTLIQQVLWLSMLQTSYTHILILVLKHNIIFYCAVQEWGWNCGGYCTRAWTLETESHYIFVHCSSSEPQLTVQKLILLISLKKSCLMTLSQCFDCRSLPSCNLEDTL